MLLTVVLILACILSGETKTSYQDFPSSIERVRLRIDSYTNKSVYSGVAHSLQKKVPLAEFKRIMQCTENEPNFDFVSGSVSLMQSIRPSKESIELLAAYREHICSPWTECQKRFIQYQNNSDLIKPNLDGHFNFNHFFLFRVINGELYYDWPWKINRFEKFGDKEVIKLMKIVLPAISDMKDSAFFAGGETASIPYHFPFPLFSNAPKMGYADMPWPWLEAWRMAQHIYLELQRKGLDINNETNYHSAVVGYLPWEQRPAKAAFFGTYETARSIMFDVGRRYPDLFDIGFGFIDCNHPFNPLSTEDCLDSEKMKHMKGTNYSHLPSGYISPFVNFEQRPYHPGAYKYVVVPIGNEAESTSGRLPILLANSDAVVLMPRMPFVYHFSAQLKPWVHYVPLAYSGADLLEKVRWLRDHDDLARQIAENGRIFARSYLRLEDYYCYAAHAMELVAELEEGTNATMPFQPVKVNRRLPHDIRPLIEDAEFWLPYNPRLDRR